MDKVIHTKAQKIFPFLKLANDHNIQYTTINIVKGETIFNDGDFCEVVPFVLNGSVRVSKIGKHGKEISIYQVSSGETCILSVTSILSSNAYPATAVVEEDVEALIIPVNDFKLFMASCNEFQEYIYKAILDRFQETLNIINEIIFQSTDQRVIHFLIKNTETDGDIIEITHDKMAINIGTAREVISRCLKEMERKGWIQLARGKIIVINRKIIEEFVTEL